MATGRINKPEQDISRPFLLSMSTGIAHSFYLPSGVCLGVIDNLRSSDSTERPA